MEKIPEFTKEDYLVTTKPYEWLHDHGSNAFALKQLIARMQAMAKPLGITNVYTMYRAFLDTLPVEQTISDEHTDFIGQDMELSCNGWIADEEGVRGRDKFGFEVVACYHPIMPVQRLVNIDDKVYKVKLAYRPGKEWKTSIEDRSTIADSRAIISLAKHDVAVTSENARYLVKYLSDVEQQNHDNIPETPSVGRLGWIDDFGFSPFVDGLVFDGAESFRSRFESIHAQGSRDVWMNAVLNARKGSTKGNVVFRIILAASFASVLVKPLHCLPFLVHLWGGSETGKTLGMLVAASVWADPEVGKYVQTFNGTAVGKEIAAAFYNSMPLMLDELQLVNGKGTKKDLDEVIYLVTEGAGRERGTKKLGLEKTLIWRNCTISTGEEPVITDNSGTGAKNRTIEIDCADIHLFDDFRPMNIIYDNYGFVGREFVEKLMEPGVMDRVRQMQERIHTEINTDELMDKQTASASLILTADALAEEWIFQDGIRLKTSDIAPFLMSKDDMNKNEKAMDFLQGVIAMNRAKFFPDNENYTGEIWGEIYARSGTIYFIKPKFDQILTDNGHSPSSFIAYAKRKKIIRVGKDGKNTINHRINGSPTRCVCFLMSELELEDNDPEEAVDDLPL